MNNTSWGKSVLEKDLPGGKVNQWSSFAFKSTKNAFDLPAVGALAYGAEKLAIDPALAYGSRWLGHTEDASYVKASQPFLFRKDISGKGVNDWKYALWLGLLWGGTYKMVKTTKGLYERGFERGGTPDPVGVFSNKGLVKEIRSKGLSAGFSEWKSGIKDGGLGRGARQYWVENLKNTYEKIYEVSGGNRVWATTVTAGKGLLWDFGVKGTGGSLFFVIAPLQGIIEVTSLAAQKYIIPSAYSKVENLALKYTIGAFWNEKSAVKYEDLANRKYSWFGSKWGAYIKRSYLAGLFGVDEGTGKAKVKSFSEGLWKDGPTTFFKKIDKTNLVFASILAVAFPFAPGVLTNIKPGNFGKKFNAVNQAFEEVVGVSAFEDISTKKFKDFLTTGQGLKDAGKMLFNRYGTMSVKGTVEEIAEQGVDILIRVSPLGMLLNPL